MGENFFLERVERIEFSLEFRVTSAISKRKAQFEKLFQVRERFTKGKSAKIKVVIEHLLEQRNTMRESGAVKRKKNRFASSRANYRRIKRSKLQWQPNNFYKEEVTLPTYLFMLLNVPKLKIQSQLSNKYSLYIISASLFNCK